MASKLGSLVTGAIGSLLQNNTGNVDAQINPTLLKFLQGQGDVAARFAGSQEGLPYGGSTATTGRAGFNQLAALLNANQTANQVAGAQQNLQAASNAGNQLSGLAQGLTQGTQGTSTSTTSIG